MATVEQLTGITAQFNELIKRVANGSLDSAAVGRALQDIIEGKLPSTVGWNPPTWWRTPAQQIERAYQLWPNNVIPEPPKEFIPRTKSEVLLLHVPDTFVSLWRMVTPPWKDGVTYAKHQWEDMEAIQEDLSLSPNKREFVRPVWVAFDPEHGRGERPDSFWGRDDLAASEVLSALIQFPEWSLAWFTDGASAPCLCGYQLKRDGNWSYLPYLGRWDGDRQLGLNVYWADFQIEDWSSPTVREC